MHLLRLAGATRCCASTGDARIGDGQGGKNSERGARYLIGETLQCAADHAPGRVGNMAGAELGADPRLEGGQ